MVLLKIYLILLCSSTLVHWTFIILFTTDGFQKAFISISWHDCSNQLAILDFNSGSNLSQAATKEGKKRYSTSFSKTTATWLAKPIKVKKSD